MKNQESVNDLLASGYKWMCLSHQSESPRYLINRNANIYDTFIDKFIMPQINGGSMTTGQYLTANIWVDPYTRKMLYVHRLVGFTLLPTPRLDRKDINHINGLKWDNVASNLEWATRSENLKHYFGSALYAKRKAEKELAAVV